MPCHLLVSVRANCARKLYEALSKTIPTQPAKAGRYSSFQAHRNITSRFYNAAATCAVVRTSWEVYPHSLSYQPKTLTMLPPVTLVIPASKIQPWESEMISVETIGSSV